MSLNLIALRGLNAYENVKLQVLSNLAMNGAAALISVGCAIWLPHQWVTVGLAAALSFSYYVGAWYTTKLLRRYEIKIHIPEVIGFYLKLALLALVIMVPLYFAESHMPGGNTLHLLAVLLISAVGYLGLARVAKVEEVRSLLEIFTRKSR